MKIVCSSVESFLTHLSENQVCLGKVFVERTKAPLNGTTQSATSFEVYLQAGAVLVMGEGEVLLEMGLFCGVDRTTADGTPEGTQVQAHQYNKLQKFCDDNRLLLRPGKLDF